MNKIQQHIKDSKRLFREKFLNIHGEPSFAMSKSAVEIVERFFSASQTSLIEKIVKTVGEDIKNIEHDHDRLPCVQCSINYINQERQRIRSILLEALKEKK